MSKHPLRILLADDHAAVRRSLRSFLELRAEVCAEVSNGQDAVAAALELKPDIALLDVAMPGIGGIEAGSEILRERPGIVVGLLTMQPSAELEEAARSARIDLVLAKSDAEALTALIERHEPRPMRFAGSEIMAGHHVAALFRSNEERDAILDAFLLDGLAAGERIWRIVNPVDEQALHQRLAANGVDVERAVARQRLGVEPWETNFTPDGRFDQQATAQRISEIISRSNSDGFPAVRVVGDMEWALLDRPGVQDLVEFESRLNTLGTSSRYTLACAYDVSKFDDALLADIRRAHPVFFEDGVLVENAEYVPPAELIRELHARRKT